MLNAMIRQINSCLNPWFPLGLESWFEPWIGLKPRGGDYIAPGLSFASFALSVPITVVTISYNGHTHMMHDICVVCVYSYSHEKWVLCALVLCRFISLWLCHCSYSLLDRVHGVFSARTLMLMQAGSHTKRPFSSFCISPCLTLILFVRSF